MEGPVYQRLSALARAELALAEEHALVAALQLQCGQQAGLITRQIDAIAGLEGEVAVLLARIAALEAAELEGAA